MKSVLLAIALLAAASAPVHAGPCDSDLAVLRAELAKSEAQTDLKTQVQDMVAQAEKLCAAGNEEEAADVISDATSMLAQ